MTNSASRETAEKLVIVGQGYVGLPIAMRGVECGFDVVGLDVDQRRIGSLAAGSSYVEDVSDADLKRALNSGRYTPTTDCAQAQGFRYAIITVPTPLKESLPDLSFIEDSARDIAPHISTGATVVLESTTYPGTTEELLVPLLEELSGLRCGEDFFVGYSPERIDPGNPKFGFASTPKVVAGVGPAARGLVIGLYEQLVDHVVPVSGTREAELTKLLENTFRHVNIALVNELAMFARDLDVDVWEAIEAASTKPFGFMKFTPGPGVGGHCLPVDPSYLSWQVKRTLNRSFRFVELANDVNEHMPDYVVQRIMLALNSRGLALRGQRVLLLGLAYKKNSSDLRESPALRVAELLDRFGAHVVASEPHAESLQPWMRVSELVDLNRSELDRATITVILTDHDAFDYALLDEFPGLVLDTRNRLGGAHPRL